MSETVSAVDIRLPMGLMFTLIGVVLAVYGMMTNGDPMYKRSGDVNINLWWGLVLTGFGLIMLLLTWRGAKKGT